MPSRRRKVGTEPVENNNSPYLGSISLLSAFCFKHAVGAVPVYYWSIRCLFEIKLIFWSILLSSFEYRLCIFQRHLTHLCIHDKISVLCISFLSSTLDEFQFHFKPTLIPFQTQFDCFQILLCPF